MKVKCIDNGEYLYITIGTVYEVLEADVDSFLVLNDVNDEVHYPKARFEEINEAVSDLVQYRYKPEVF